MKSNKLFFIGLIFLLAIPLAFATTLEVSQNDAGEIVLIGTCDNADVFVSFQAGIGINSVWVDQVTAVGNSYETSFMPPQDANYIIYAACNGESNVQKGICTGSGCVVPATPSTPSAPSGGGGGGGGGGGCRAEWKCDNYWSVCPTNLTQSRTCFDQRCNQKPKTEFRDCEPCVESWICYAWSECENGVQTRQCIEEHYCGTNEKMPVMEQSCSSGVTPSVPAKTYTPPQIQQPTPELSFWDQYKWYIIWPLLILLIIALLVFAYFFFIHKKQHKKAYNMDELKVWIRKEKAAGTSEADIRHILKTHSGWEDHEIDHALGIAKSPTYSS